MKNFKQLIILSICVVTIFTACKKYEDGPAISFLSRSHRVANDWKVEKAILNGEEITGSFDKYDVSFTKDGVATLTAHYTFAGIEYEYSTTGTWIFESNDEKLTVNYDNDLADATYIILRLKEKELWLRQENTNLELHLSPR